jgi:hypothetical protein
VVACYPDGGIHFLSLFSLLVFGYSSAMPEHKHRRPSSPCFSCTGTFIEAWGRKLCRGARWLRCGIWASTDSVASRKSESQPGGRIRPRPGVHPSFQGTAETGTPGFGGARQQTRRSCYGEGDTSDNRAPYVIVFARTTSSARPVGPTVQWPQERAWWGVGLAD